MPSITINIIFWFISPIIILFASAFVTSLFSLKKRYGIKAPDIAVPFLFIAIHRLSYLVFKESLFPYFLITISLLGICLAFFPAFFYEVIDYSRYAKLYWRSVFLFSMVTQFILIVLSLMLRF